MRVPRHTVRTPNEIPKSYCRKTDASLKDHRQFTDPHIQLDAVCSSFRKEREQKGP